LAVLKAIGFPPRRILAAVLGESTLLGLIGGGGGCLGALLVVGQAASGKLNMPYFPTIHVTWVTVGLGVAAGALVGVLAGLPPAGHVALRPVTVTLRDDGGG
jgi:putative ABC transport system permease protein